MIQFLLSLPVRISCLLLAFVLLCFLHGKNWGAEDLLGTPLPVTQLDTATAAAAAVKLPAAVQSLIDKSDGDVAKIEAKAHDETVKNRQALAEKLSKAQADATKKGDLTLALAIKARIEALDLPVAAPVVAPVDTATAAKAVVGTWAIASSGWNGVWTIQAGFTAASPGIAGTWSIAPDGKVKISWANGNVEWLHLEKPTDTKGRATLASGAEGTCTKR